MCTLLCVIIYYISRFDFEKLCNTSELNFYDDSEVYNHANRNRPFYTSCRRSGQNFRSSNTYYANVRLNFVKYIKKKKIKIHAKKNNNIIIIMKIIIKTTKTTISTVTITHYRVAWLKLVYYIIITIILGLRTST